MAIKDLSPTLIAAIQDFKDRYRDGPFSFQCGVSSLEQFAERIASLAVQERRQTWGHCGNCGGTEFVVVETCETCGMSEQLERVKGQAQHPPEETR